LRSVQIANSPKISGQISVLQESYFKCKTARSSECSFGLANSECLRRFR
jgi:hypothetical protein